jgi:hypothetical protein
MKRWYFWVLAPIMLGSAIVIPLVAAPVSVVGYVMAYVLACTLVLATLGLADTTRFRWALRSVAGVIVVGGLLYFVSELTAWWAGKPIGAFGRRSDSSLWNAGLFLLVFGVPALRYLLSGRSESVVDVIAAPEVLNDTNAPSAPESPQSEDRRRTVGERATDIGSR